MISVAPVGFVGTSLSRADLARRKDLVCFDHLLKVLGKRCNGKLLISVYTENKAGSGPFAHYVPVGAPGEGTYCVDDVARAVVALLQGYTAKRRSYLLKAARAGLDFIMMMQAPDGEFYNFVELCGNKIEINRDGPTSRKSIDFWAARALWALCVGYGVLREVDLDEACILAEYINRTCARITSQAPASGGSWLVNGAGDQTAIVVMGLVSYYRALGCGGTRLRSLIEGLCDGMMQAQVTEGSDRGRFLHSVSSPEERHLWGSHQVAALADAGSALGRADWIASASLCASDYWRRGTAATLLAPGEDQLAYGVEAVVSGYARLFEATHGIVWEDMVFYWAAWFFGMNNVRAIMYDPLSGRGYDGIVDCGDGHWRVNDNSGAESTIEAILALQAATRVPGVVRKLRVQLHRVLPA